MQDAVLPASQTVRVTQDRFCVSRYLCQAGEGCLCGASTPAALDLSVLNLSQAEDQVQNGTKPAVLFFDVHAARGRKGVINLVHRLGNRTMSYKSPIKPRKADVDLTGLSPADMHEKSNIVSVSKSEYRLITKASKHLLPQLVRLQQDTQTHERYLDPEVSDVAAVYMQQADTLLAGCDEGLTAIVKLQHGVRQGTISVSLAKAQIQLSVLLADGTCDVCAITSIPQAFAILLDTGIGRKAFLSAKSILKLNTIHPADIKPTHTLVTSASADSMLQQQAMLDLLQLCRNKEGCDDRLLAECISQGGIEALVDKVSDSSTDNAQLAQKLYDVLVLTLETLPDTAEILQRLLLALQRALQARSSSLILAQLVLNLMQLPVVRKAARLAALSHSLASYLNHQQEASTQINPSSIAAAKPAVKTWNLYKLLPGAKQKYSMADQVQPSTGSVSEAEPIELSGLVDAEWQPDWQSKHRQAQQAAAALQTKVAVVRSVLYLTPLLEEEPASTPLVASALVHEVMSSMTARASVDQQHDTELRNLCLVALLSHAVRRPAVADVMLLEAHGDILSASSHKVCGHALLSHIAAGLLRIRSLSQDALGMCQCLQLLTHYTQITCNPYQALLLNSTCVGALTHCHELLLSSGPPDTWTHMISMGFTKLLGFQTVCMRKARRAGNVRILLGIFLGDDRLVHTCRAFATYQLTCQPEGDAAIAVLEFYAVLARLVAACPAQGIDDQTVLPLPAQLYQNAIAQTDHDVLTYMAGCQHELPPTSGQVTRGQAVQLFDFLLHPVAERVPSLQAAWLDQSLEFQQKTVELMTAVYSIACSHCIVDSDCSKVHCHWHWKAFTAAYAAEEADIACIHLSALQALARHKGASVQQHLREQDVVGFLLQEFGRAVDMQITDANIDSTAAVSAPGTQEQPVSRLASLMEIHGPPSRLTKSLDLKIAPAVRTQPSHSPKIAAQQPDSVPGSSRCIIRAASSLKPAHHSGMNSVDSQTISANKFPPGFISSGDLEEDLDRLMELDSQGGNSGASSVAQSPPQSARLSARSVRLPPLSPAAPRPALPPLPIISASQLALLSLPISTARIDPQSRTPLSSSRSRLTVSPGRTLSASQTQSQALPSQTSTGLDQALSAGPIVQTDTPKTPTLTSARQAAPVATSPAALSAHKVPRLSFASQSSFPDALATSQTRQGSLGISLSACDQATAHTSHTVSQHRQPRTISKNDNLHVQMVQLLMELLLTANGQLEPAHQPHSHATQHIWPMAVLQQHISHAEKAHFATPLLRWARAHSASAVLLLRLSCRHLFDDSLYRERQSIGQGAFARVFKCRLPGVCQHQQPVAVKITDLSQVGEGHDSQATAFREISMMQRLSSSPGVCQLHDYGITNDSILLVMPKYKCSLREWRQGQPTQPKHQLRLYLNIFCKIAELVQELAMEQVVHFDLKCDNVLVEPLPGVEEAAFWAPTSDQLPFQVVLADFGDSCDFHQSQQKFTTRNQGTESIRAPEMLLMSNGAESDSQSQASQAGAPCDVWALGCLLYELVTGALLFPSEPDWSKFYITVTDAKKDLFMPEVLAALQAVPAVLELLDFTLVRNPLFRPTAAEVTVRVQGVMTGSRHTLPTYCRPVVLPCFTLRRSTTLPTTHSLPPVLPLTPSTAPLNAIPSQQLIPVTSQLYLGTLGSLSDPLLLQQATIRHAIVVSNCKGDEGLTPKDGGLPVLGDLLQWLLTDSERARGLAVCTAGGIPCKMVPVQLSDEVGASESGNMWCSDRLPKLVKHIAQVLADPNKRLVIAASPGCQEHAAALAVAHAVHNEGLKPYKALVQLQHAYHLLKAADVGKQQLFMSNQELQ